MGDVAKQTEAQYCTEYRDVNEEATWVESLWAYPERTDSKPAKGEAHLLAANGNSDVVRYYQ